MLKKRDESLIRLLSKDASQSSEKLARKMGCSAATIRRRTNRLLREDILRVVAVPDPQKTGLPVAAFLSMEVPQATVSDISADLNALSEVKWVSTTTGKNNLIAFIRTASFDELNRFLHDTLARVREVKSCETQLCLDVKGKIKL